MAIVSKWAKNKRKRRKWSASRGRFWWRDVEERETRRRFDYDAEFKFTNELEWRRGSVRFIYDLTNDTFYWQRKLKVKRHVIVCPSSIEMCYHSLESPPANTFLHFPYRVPGNFFFGVRSATKKVLFRSGRTVAYVRESRCVRSGHVECEMDEGSNSSARCVPDPDDYDSYMSLVEKHGARLPPSFTSERGEPPVKQATWSRVKEDARLVAVKWDGYRRVMELDHLLDGRGASAGIRYCVEICEGGTGIVVDVCLPNLNPVDRAVHLQSLPADKLWKRGRLLIQRFVVPQNDSDDAAEDRATENPRLRWQEIHSHLLAKFSAAELVRLPPNDGLIVLCSDYAYKIKPADSSTVDLWAVADHLLCDRDGYVYPCPHKVLAPSTVYECLLDPETGTATSVLRTRCRKLFPNPASTVDKIRSINRGVTEEESSQHSSRPTSQDP